MKKVILLFILIMCMMFTVGCDNANTDNGTQAVLFNKKQMEERNLKEYIENNYLENLQTYKDKNGRTVMYMFTAPIEEYALGVYESDGKYFSNSSYTDVILPDKLSANEGILVENGYGSLKIMPADRNEYTSKLTNAKNAFGQKRTAIRYENMFGKGIHYYCYATSFGLNTEIVLPKKVETNTFQIKICIDNMIPESTSLDYILFKKSLDALDVGQIIYTPIAVDKKNKYSYKNSVKLIEKDTSTDTYTVEYTIDKEFLESEDTVYPVTLNQSVHIYYPKQPDLSVYEDADEELGFYLSPYLLLGKSEDRGDGWAFIRYEVFNEIDISPEKVVSVKYTLNNLFDLDKPAIVSLYAVTDEWCSINTRWFSRPSFDENPVARIAINEAGDYSLDITPLFKEMMKNKGKGFNKYSIDNGFFIKCETENGSLIIATGDNGIFSPFLEIVLED